ncbi:hypothetical protein BH11PLA2_BH11PLA2_10450 [soil metagenome]
MNRKQWLVTTAGLLALALPLAAQFPLFPTTKKAAAVEKAVDPAKDDSKSLSEAKLAADNPAGLIAYFKGRTLSDADLNKIMAVIKRMGDEEFEMRVKASAEAESFGLAAIGPLRTAAQGDPDPEIQFRSLETLRRIEKVSHAAVASAAARVLAKSKDPNAAAALIGFLPMADNATVDDDLRLALKSLALHDGKLEPALINGLKDVNAIRRAASAVALIEASLEQKKSQEEVTKLVVPMLKDEKDDDAKFRVAFVLGTTGKNVDAIKALVETLPSLPRGRIWQVEDILLQLAGDKAPKLKLGPDKVALEKARDEWVKWLAANRKPEDYAKFDYKPRTNGRIQILTMDQNWGGGRISELGPDLKQRWRMSGINTPADFQMLPNGNMEVMEHNYSRITERDLRGNIKNNRNLPGGPPMSVQKLDNGNMLIAYRQSVVEYDKDLKALNTWTRNNGDVLYASKLGNGPVVVLVQNPGSLIRLDDKFKELPNPTKLAGQPYYQAKMELLPGDRALVTEQDKIAEYSLKDGKQLWKYAASNPTCVQRLASGNTLVVDMGNRTIKEVTEDGTAVWTYTPPDNLQPMRAYRQ